MSSPWKPSEKNVSSHQLSRTVEQDKEDKDRVRAVRQQCAVPGGLDESGSVEQ